MGGRGTGQGQERRETQGVAQCKGLGPLHNRGGTPVQGWGGGYGQRQGRRQAQGVAQCKGIGPLRNSPLDISPPLIGRGVSYFTLKVQQIYDGSYPEMA